MPRLMVLLPQPSQGGASTHLQFQNTWKIHTQDSAVRHQWQERTKFCSNDFFFFG